MTHFQCPSIQLWSSGEDEAEVLPADVLVGVAVADTVPDVTLTVLVAVVGAADVAV